MAIKEFASPHLFEAKVFMVHRKLDNVFRMLEKLSYINEDNTVMTARVG